MFSGHVRLVGHMQEAGMLLTMTIDGQGTARSGQRLMNIDIRAEMVIGGPNDTYISVQSLTMEPQDSATASVLGQFLGRWWKLPSTAQDGVVPLNTEARLLQMQAEIITVTRDRGFARVDGRWMYQYDIAVDREKLRSFLTAVAEQGGRDADASLAAWDTYNMQGQIWIDANTFRIHRILWALNGNAGQTPSTLTIDTTITDVNVPQPIAFPRDAEPLPTSLTDVFPAPGYADGALEPDTLFVP